MPSIEVLRSLDLDGLHAADPGAIGSAGLVAFDGDAPPSPSPVNGRTEFNSA